MAAQLYCSIENCENPLSPRSKLPICALCRGSMGSWQKRKPAEIKERRRRLHLYDSRMEQLADYKPMKRKRAS